MTQPEKVEVATCPFCGGEASDTGRVTYSRPLEGVTWADGQPVLEAFFVNCITCGASSALGVAGGHRTQAEAIAAWNTRATQSTHAAQIAELVEGLRAIDMLISSAAIRDVVKVMRKMRTLARALIAKHAAEGGQ